MDLPSIGTWLLSVVAVPLAVGVCSQLFAERARREHLRLARDQFELADLLERQARAADAEELRRRAASETAKYLRPARRPRYVFILLGWAYLGMAIAIMGLAEIQTAAQAGPGPVANWIVFGLIGILSGVTVAGVHIALKDLVLDATNRALGMVTRGRLTIPRPGTWPTRTGD